jgi:hypothetical protein
MISSVETEHLWKFIQDSRLSLYPVGDGWAVSFRVHPQQKVWFSGQDPSQVLEWAFRGEFPPHAVYQNEAALVSKPILRRCVSALLGFIGFMYLI